MNGWGEGWVEGRQCQVMLDAKPGLQNPAGGGSLLGGLKASLSYPRSRHLISGWISETGMQTRNHSWRQRFGSYLHIYTRSEVMRVTEIPQRQRRTVKSFQHRNLTTVWQPRENAGAQRSTLRVENSLRKNLPVVGNTAVRSTEVKSPKKNVPRTQRRGHK